MLENLNKKLRVLLILSFFLLISTFIPSLNSLFGHFVNDTVEYEEKNKNISAYTNLDYIHIDDRGAGDFTWSELENAFTWCTGNGTKLNPYIIENIAVNGKNTSSSLYISNSIIYFEIKNCLFFNSSDSNFHSGIRFFNVSNGVIFNSTIKNNNNHGIYLREANYCNFVENLISTNKFNGIYVFLSDNNTLQGNRIEANGERAIYLHTSMENLISNNFIYNNSPFTAIGAVYIQSAENNKLYNNTISTNYGGIFASSSDKNYFEKNLIKNNDNYGIILNSQSDNCTIKNNTIYNNTQNGMEITLSTNTLIYKNNVSSNSGYGIRLYSSSLTNITENSIIENFDDGIFLNGDNNSVYYNKIIKNQGNGIYAYSMNVQGSSYNKFINNSIIGNSENAIRFNFNTQPVQYNIISKNYIFNNTNAAINLYRTHNNTISLNYFIACNTTEYTAAIYLATCLDCSITENTFINNGVCVQLRNTNRTLISHNTMEKTQRYGFNIQLQSSYNEIIENTINDNMNGIYLYQGNYNNVTENIISNSSNSGIYVQGPSPSSNYNLFYENFFLENTIHALDNAGTNYWNNSEVGNYWDNYPGVDDSPEDGIGDSSYSSNGVMDYLPIWDDDNPVIFINLPANNSRQPNQAPNFNVIGEDVYFDSIWYTIDNGLTNTTINANGSIDQSYWLSIWNVLSDGQYIELTFYANDTFGHIGSNKTFLIKDAFPEINLISPLNGTEIGRVSLDFIIEVSDFSRDDMWYTIDGNNSKYFFTLNGTIQTAPFFAA
ncbi:MAG: hypothetical protein GF316_14020, partial [Candidatus Lokiarchaeota archaeon]|nr:hypothetical protein [Candidatus Lokiarchaeota archaeon]